MLIKFLFDDQGATAIEYTLIAATMAALLVAVMPAYSGAFTTAIGKVVSEVANLK